MESRLVRVLMLRCVLMMICASRILSSHNDTLFLNDGGFTISPVIPQKSISHERPDEQS